MKLCILEDVFNGQIKMRGHGNMLGNCQSKVLVKLVDVVIKDWTIPFCLKVHLGKHIWVFCFGPNQTFDFELALGTSRTKSYCEKCQSWKKHLVYQYQGKLQKLFKCIVSKTIHCFKNNLQKWVWQKMSWGDPSSPTNLVD